MIPLIVGAASSLIGGAAKAISTSQAAKRKREAEQQRLDMLDKSQKRLDDYYKQESSTNVLDTSSARSTLAMLRERNRRVSDQMSNNIVRNNGSDESKVALASRLNESYAQAASRIAGNGEERRRQLEQMRYNTQNAIDQSKSNILYQTAMGKADALNSFGDIASSALGGLGSIGSLFGKYSSLTKVPVSSSNSNSSSSGKDWSEKSFGEF